MNLENNPTVEELQELVKGCDDFASHHIVWVKKNGEVLISQISEDQTPTEFEEAHPEMQLRLEMFERGNEYVGPEAALDQEWIRELFQNLEDAWQNAKGKQGVACIDVI